MQLLIVIYIYFYVALIKEIVLLYFQHKQFSHPVKFSSYPLPILLVGCSPIAL